MTRRDPDTPIKVFTLDDLTFAGPDRAAVERWWEDEVDRLDLGDTYDDCLDRLDDSPWLVGRVWHRIELPERVDDPVYVRLRNIGRQVRAELTS